MTIAFCLLPIAYRRAIALLSCEGEGESEGEGEADIVYINTITCCILPIDCLLVALDAHIFSHNGYGPGTKDQGPEAAGPGPGGPQLLSPRVPYPLWLNICASRAINRQSISNIQQVILLITCRIITSMSPSPSPSFSPTYVRYRVRTYIRTVLTYRFATSDALKRLEYLWFNHHISTNTCQNNHLLQFEAANLFVLK